MHLYHGTLGARRHRFEPFCHFGTRSAAVERIAWRLLEGNQGNPILLKLRFKFEEQQILQLNEDWGSHRSMSLASALQRHFKERDPDKFAIFEQIRSDLYAAQTAGQEFHKRGWEQLSNVFQKLGVRAIRYPNDVEDSGAFSYCVVEPTRRVCIGTSKPTLQELEIGKETVRAKLGGAI